MVLPVGPRLCIYGLEAQATVRALWGAHRCDDPGSTAVSMTKRKSVCPTDSRTHRVPVLKIQAKNLLAGAGLNSESLSRRPHLAAFDEPAQVGGLPGVLHVVDDADLQ